MSAGNTLPSIAPGLLVAVGVGGLAGSRLGAFHQWLPIIAWGAAWAHFSTTTQRRIILFASRASGLLLIYASAVTLVATEEHELPHRAETLGRPRRHIEQATFHAAYGDLR